jgi:hypothetical protein
VPIEPFGTKTVKIVELYEDITRLADGKIGESFPWFDEYWGARKSLIALLGHKVQTP